MTDAPYTVADLMRATGLGRDSVRAALKAGTLPGYKIGKRFVIPAEAFHAFCRGEWKPQPVQIVVTPISPIRTIRRAS